VPKLLADTAHCSSPKAELHACEQALLLARIVSSPVAVKDERHRNTQHFVKVTGLKRLAI
jgi:hypothetical protein